MSSIPTISIFPPPSSNANQLTNFSSSQSLFSSSGSLFQTQSLSNNSSSLTNQSTNLPSFSTFSSSNKPIFSFTGFNANFSATQSNFSNTQQFSTSPAVSTSTQQQFSFYTSSSLPNFSTSSSLIGQNSPTNSILFSSSQQNNSIFSNTSANQSSTLLPSSLQHTVDSSSNIFQSNSLTSSNTISSTLPTTSFNASSSLQQTNLFSFSSNSNNEQKASSINQPPSTTSFLQFSSNPSSSSTSLATPFFTQSSSSLQTSNLLKTNFSNLSSLSANSLSEQKNTNSEILSTFNNSSNSKTSPIQFSGNSSSIPLNQQPIFSQQSSSAVFNTSTNSISYNISKPQQNKLLLGGGRFEDLYIHWILPWLKDGNANALRAQKLKHFSFNEDREENNLISNINYQNDDSVISEQDYNILQEIEHAEQLDEAMFTKLMEEKESFLRLLRIPPRRPNVTFDDLHSHILEVYPGWQKICTDVYVLSYYLGMDQFECMGLTYDAIKSMEFDGSVAWHPRLVVEMLHNEQHYELMCLLELADNLHKYERIGVSNENSNSKEENMNSQSDISNSVCVSFFSELIKRNFITICIQTFSQLIRQVLYPDQELGSSIFSPSSVYGTSLPSSGTTSFQKYLHEVSQVHYTKMIFKLADILQILFLRFQLNEKEVEGLLQLLPHLVASQTTFSSHSMSLSAFDFDASFNRHHPLLSSISPLSLSTSPSLVTSSLSQLLSSKISLLLMITLHPKINRWIIDRSTTNSRQWPKDFVFPQTTEFNTMTDPTDFEATRQDHQLLIQQAHLTRNNGKLAVTNDNQNLKISRDLSKDEDIFEDISKFWLRLRKNKTSDPEFWNDSTPLGSILHFIISGLYLSDDSVMIEDLTTKNVIQFIVDVYLNPSCCSEAIGLSTFLFFHEIFINLFIGEDGITSIWVNLLDQEIKKKRKLGYIDQQTSPIISILRAFNLIIRRLPSVSPSYLYLVKNCIDRYTTIWENLPTTSSISSSSYLSRNPNQIDPTNYNQLPLGYLVDSSSINQFGSNTKADELGLLQIAASTIGVNIDTYSPLFIELLSISSVLCGYGGTKVAEGILSHFNVPSLMRLHFPLLFIKLFDQLKAAIRGQYISLPQQLLMTTSSILPNSLPSNHYLPNITNPYLLQEPNNQSDFPYHFSNNISRFSNSFPPVNNNMYLRHQNAASNFFLSSSSSQHVLPSYRTSSAGVALLPSDASSLPLSTVLVPSYTHPIGLLGALENCLRLAAGAMHLRLYYILPPAYPLLQEGLECKHIRRHLHLLDAIYTILRWDSSVNTTSPPIPLYGIKAACLEALTNGLVRNASTAFSVLHEIGQNLFPIMQRDLENSLKQDEGRFCIAFLTCIVSLLYFVGYRRRFNATLSPDWNDSTLLNEKHNTTNLTASKDNFSSGLNSGTGLKKVPNTTTQYLLNLTDFIIKSIFLKIFSPQILIENVEKYNIPETRYWRIALLCFKFFRLILRGPLPPLFNKKIDEASRESFAQHLADYRPTSLLIKMFLSNNSKYFDTFMYLICNFNVITQFQIKGRIKSGDQSNHSQGKNEETDYYDFKKLNNSANYLSNTEKSTSQLSSTKTKPFYDPVSSSEIFFKEKVTAVGLDILRILFQRDTLYLHCLKSVFHSYTNNQSNNANPPSQNNFVQKGQQKTSPQFMRTFDPHPFGDVYTVVSDYGNNISNLNYIHEQLKLPSLFISMIKGDNKSDSSNTENSNSKKNILLNNNNNSNYIQDDNNDNKLNQSPEVNTSNKEIYLSALNCPSYASHLISLLMAPCVNKASISKLLVFILRQLYLREPEHLSKIINQSSFLMYTLKESLCDLLTDISLDSSVQEECIQEALIQQSKHNQELEDLKKRNKLENRILGGFSEAQIFESSSSIPKEFELILGYTSILSDEELSDPLNSLFLNSHFLEEPNAYQKALLNRVKQYQYDKDHAFNNNLFSGNNLFFNQSGMSRRHPHYIKPLGNAKENSLFKHRAIFNKQINNIQYADNNMAANVSPGPMHVSHNQSNIFFTEKDTNLLSKQFFENQEKYIYTQEISEIDQMTDPNNFLTPLSSETALPFHQTFELRWLRVEDALMEGNDILLWHLLCDIEKNDLNDENISSTDNNVNSQFNKSNLISSTNNRVNSAPNHFSSKVNPLSFIDHLYRWVQSGYCHDISLFTSPPNTSIYTSNLTSSQTASPSTFNQFSYPHTPANWHICTFHAVPLRLMVLHLISSSLEEISQSTDFLFTPLPHSLLGLQLSKRHPPYHIPSSVSKIVESKDNLTGLSENSPNHNDIHSSVNNKDIYNNNNNNNNNSTVSLPYIFVEDASFTSQRSLLQPILHLAIELQPLQAHLLPVQNAQMIKQTENLSYETNNDLRGVRFESNLIEEENNRENIPAYQGENASFVSSVSYQKDADGNLIVESKIEKKNIASLIQLEAFGYHAYHILELLCTHKQSQDITLRILQAHWPTRYQAITSLLRTPWDRILAPLKPLLFLQLSSLLQVCNVEIAYVTEKAILITTGEYHYAKRSSEYKNMVQKSDKSSHNIENFKNTFSNRKNGHFYDSMDASIEPTSLIFEDYALSTHKSLYHMLKNLQNAAHSMLQIEPGIIQYMNDILLQFPVHTSFPSFVHNETFQFFNSINNNTSDNSNQYPEKSFSQLNYQEFPIKNTEVFNNEQQHQSQFNYFDENKYINNSEEIDSEKKIKNDTQFLSFQQTVSISFSRRLLPSIPVYICIFDILSFLKARALYKPKEACSFLHNHHIVNNLYAYNLYLRYQSFIEACISRLPDTLGGLFNILSSPFLAPFLTILPTEENSISQNSYYFYQMSKIGISYNILPASSMFSWSSLPYTASSLLQLTTFHSDVLMSLLIPSQLSFYNTHQLMCLFSLLKKIVWTWWALIHSSPLDVGRNTVWSYPTMLAKKLLQILLSDAHILSPAVRTLLYQSLNYLFHLPSYTYKPLPEDLTTQNNFNISSKISNTTINQNIAHDNQNLSYLSQKNAYPQVESHMQQEITNRMNNESPSQMSFISSLKKDTLNRENSEEKIIGAFNAVATYVLTTSFKDFRYRTIFLNLLFDDAIGIINNNYIDSNEFFSKANFAEFQNIKSIYCNNTENKNYFSNISDKGMNFKDFVCIDNNNMRVNEINDVNKFENINNYEKYRTDPASYYDSKYHINNPPLSLFYNQFFSQRNNNLNQNNTLSNIQDEFLTNLSNTCNNSQLSQAALNVLTYILDGLIARSIQADIYGGDLVRSISLDKILKLMKKHLYTNTQNFEQSSLKDECYPALSRKQFQVLNDINQTKSHQSALALSTCVILLSLVSIPSLALEFMECNIDGENLLDKFLQSNLLPFLTSHTPLSIFQSNYPFDQIIQLNLPLPPLRLYLAFLIFIQALLDRLPILNSLFVSLLNWLNRNSEIFLSPFRVFYSMFTSQISVVNRLPSNQNTNTYDLFKHLFYYPNYDIDDNGMGDYERSNFKEADKGYYNNSSILKKKNKSNYYYFSHSSSEENDFLNGYYASFSSQLASQPLHILLRLANQSLRLYTQIIKLHSQTRCIANQWTNWNSLLVNEIYIANDLPHLLVGLTHILTSPIFANMNSNNFNNKHIMDNSDPFSSDSSIFNYQFLNTKEGHNFSSTHQNISYLRAYNFFTKSHYSNIINLWINTITSFLSNPNIKITHDISSSQQPKLHQAFAYDTSNINSDIIFQSHEHTKQIDKLRWDTLLLITLSHCHLLGFLSPNFEFKGINYDTKLDRTAKMLLPQFIDISISTLVNLIFLKSSGNSFEPFVFQNITTDSESVQNLLDSAECSLYGLNWLLSLILKTPFFPPFYDTSNLPKKSLFIIQHPFMCAANQSKIEKHQQFLNLHPKFTFLIDLLWIFKHLCLINNDVLTFSYSQNFATKNENLTRKFSFGIEHNPFLSNSHLKKAYINQSTQTLSLTSLSAFVNQLYNNINYFLS